MTKKDIANKLEDLGFAEARTDTLTQVKEIFNIITEALANGEEVSIDKFGKFSTSIQAAKSGSMQGKAWTSEAKQRTPTS